jgi:pimeloyl-ACP methyl ester carboxylesterase
MNRIALLSVLVLLGGCATREPLNPAYDPIDPGKLPPADITLNIPGLGPCTDNPDRSLHFASNQPVNVLVHGCRGSSGQFRGLAQVLAFHGQQTACFSYDDRAGLTQTASELRRAVDQLAEQTRMSQITVIGHSMGALIARKSLTALPSISVPRRQPDLHLVTISGPFDGIASAQTCGSPWLHPVTLGLLTASCYIVTGPKWADITYSSRFIREPGALIPQVGNYLKIDTDERGTCRREANGRCVEGDDVFSLAEQRNTQVENAAQRVEVQAGHVEIVGDNRVAPTKLIAILQAQGVIRPTAPERLSAFNLLLAQVYEDAPALNQDAVESHPH